MEEILRIVERLLKTEDRTKLVNQFYKKFCEIKINDRTESGYFFEYVLPKINELHNKDIIRKDILYLSLLGSNNLELLRKCIKFNKNILELDLASPTKLYDYCVYKRQHWFGHFVSSGKTSKIANRKIVNSILTLRLIELSNSLDISVENLKEVLLEIDGEMLSDFWKNYILQIKHFIDIVEFCQQRSPAIPTNDIFPYVRENSVLQTFSNYFELRESNWKDILRWIQKEETHSENKAQSTNFIAFTILGHLLNCITKTPNLNVIEAVENAKTDLLNIQDIRFQLELLENIFAMIFSESKHFSNERDSRLVCERKEIRLVLYLLKEVLEEMKMKPFLEKDSEEYSKFSQLNKLVADGLWRIDLIESVKSPEKCEKHLLRYMLSPPE
ncbi:hypothetical protein JTB14_031661 [Gonioctena quinquepunctata]|nr:hypothetical protein JTB14_031661 [Gonioctena quinquepunctata]